MKDRLERTIEEVARHHDIEARGQEVDREWIQEIYSDMNKEDQARLTVEEFHERVSRQIEEWNDYRVDQSNERKAHRMQSQSHDTEMSW